MPSRVLPVFLFAAAGCLAPVTDRLDQSNRQVELSNQQLAQISQQMTRSNQNVEETNRRLEQIAKEIAATNRRLDAIEKRLPRIPGFGAAQPAYEAGTGAGQGSR